MKIDCLREKMEKNRFKFLGTMFLEDGYEIRFRLDKNEFEDKVELKKYAESVIDLVNGMNYEDIVISDITSESFVYSFMVVPKSLEEMTDFIWKYVEKYGRREEKLIDILRDAFCALEKAIDEIPENISGKTTAKANFEKFTTMIF